MSNACVVETKGRGRVFPTRRKCFFSEIMVESEINYAANEWRAGLRKEEKITLI